MNLPILIQKNNILIDANIPSKIVLSNKLVNVLYHQYEKNGSLFNITIPELLRMLELSPRSSSNVEKLKDAIRILQYPIELRDFSHNGLNIKWISAPFLAKAKILKDYSNIIYFEINEDIVSGLKQKSYYTEIDINISNKFQSKFGIVLWEMYLRYNNQYQKGISPNISTQSFSLDELNQKFSSNYDYNAIMLRSLNRGLKEIEKITGKEISVKWSKIKQKFSFIWEKDSKIPNISISLKDFIMHIRKNITNVLLMNLKQDGIEIPLSCSDDGFLYNMNNQVLFKKEKSQELWNYLFENQDLIIPDI